MSQMFTTTTSTSDSSGSSIAGIPVRWLVIGAGLVLVGWWFL